MRIKIFKRRIIIVSVFPVTFMYIAMFMNVAIVQYFGKHKIT